MLKINKTPPEMLCKLNFEFGELLKMWKEKEFEH